MKDKFPFFCFLLLLWCRVNAQHEDEFWLTGYRSGPVVTFNTQDSTFYAVSTLNFNSSPVVIKMDSPQMRFDATNTSMCDSNGKLLFYTNGIYIANRWDEKIEGSDSLNPSAFQYEWDPNIQEFGYRIPQGIVALESSKQKGLYYLFHVMIDTIIGWDIRPEKLLYTTLDMNANNGHGKVLSKNVVLVSDYISSGLAVCKHSNGKDWWVMVQDMNSNCYYKILLDNNGPVLQSSKTCSGVVVPDTDPAGWRVFSPDGTKFADYSLIKSTVQLSDFNRCYGEFTNTRQLPTMNALDSGWYGGGVAFSPNSRFLYFANIFFVYQYDTWAADIAASSVTIAEYDGFMAPFGSYFNTMQLAPDGKIYGSCGNAEYVWHVINSPDSKGSSCHFRQHGLRLLTYSGGVPYYPNYRLGAQPCYGVGVAPIAALQHVRLFPNPATNHCLLDYGHLNWEASKDVQLTVTNLLGAAMYETQLPHYSAIHQINLQDYSSGLYVVTLHQGGQVVWKGKVVRE